MTMIQNKTDLQLAILHATHGYEIQEVLHAFEVIKLDILLNSGEYQ